MKCPKCQATITEDSHFCSACGVSLRSSEETRTLQSPALGPNRDQVIADKYRIIQKIGEGGMGVVYKAQDTKLDRPVALKFLPPELTRDSDSRKRFIQEAKAAAALNHPNITVIHEIGEDRGQTFIAMEFIDGRTLKQKMDEGHLEIEEAVNIVSQVAEGLKEAHEKGIIHRDVKPANIMLTKGGQAKIMDFGLAKLTVGAELTKPSMIMGTAAYMSPEQARGEDIDLRTDIWSLGTMFYEMLTGASPFPGDDTRATLHAILAKDPTPASSIRPNIPSFADHILNNTLAKERNERYQNMVGLIKDLGTMKSELKEKSPAWVHFLITLWKRRIPQVLGIYFAILFGIVRTVDWLVNRFVLSSHLPDFVGIGVLSLFPAVFLLTYFTGKTKDVKRTFRPLRALLVLNLAGTAVLLFLLFNGKDLGAATKIVAVSDEEGQVVEKTVPKQEFRKKFAIYFFQNESGNPALDWAQFALSAFLGFDLSQDLFLEVRTGYELHPYLEKARIADQTDVPLTLMAKVANDIHLGFFIDGSITQESQEYVSKIRIYEARRIKLISECEIRSESLFRVIDELSLLIKRDLGLPQRYIQEAKDLPVTEITTAFEETLKMYVEALNSVQKNEWAKAIEILEGAVAFDPGFALAYYQLQVLYAYANQSEKREAIFQALMQTLYKLPERLQYAAKVGYYSLREDSEKALAVVRMWTEIFPDDVEAHLILAMFHEQDARLEDALAEYRTILDLDPSRTDAWLRMGAIYELRNEPSEALKFYERYRENHPEDVSVYLIIGKLYKDIGEFAQSRDSLEKALLIEPDSLPAMRQLADIHKKLGEFPEALSQLQDVLERSRQPQEKIGAYAALIAFYAFRAQYELAFENMRLKWELIDTTLPEASAFLEKLTDLDVIIQSGDKERAFREIGEFERRITAPWDRLVPLGYLGIYAELEDAAGIERYIPGVESMIEAFNMETLRPVLSIAQGIIHRSRGEYSEAVVSFQEGMNRNNMFVDALPEIGLCYSLLKDYKRAEESFLKYLKLYPFDAETNVKLAAVYEEMGDSERAINHLERAMSTWAEADPGQSQVEEARKRLAELR